MNRSTTLHQFFRIVAIFIVIAQYIVLRNHFLNDYILRDYSPVEGEFFPEFLSNPYMAAFFLAFGILLGLFVSFSERGQGYFTHYASYLVVFNFFMNIHQQGFFVQSFVTSFWVGLLLLWMALSMRQEEGDSNALTKKVMFLSKVIVSLVFLGGTLGKLNDYYWSGRAFENLDIHNPIIPLIGYGIYGKMVVVGEGLLALLILMPDRWAFRLALSLISGMWLLTGYKIFDAIGPIIGLSFANVFLQSDWLMDRLSTRNSLLVFSAGLFVFANVFFKLVTLYFYR